jgi:hypothetical protein
LLKIPFNAEELFRGSDPEFELWLLALVERVNETKRVQYEESKNG